MKPQGFLRLDSRSDQQLLHRCTLRQLELQREVLDVLLQLSAQCLDLESEEAE